MRLRTAGLVFLGLAIGASCQAETLFVSLRPVALVDRTEFRLADISEIVGRQRQAIDQLGNLIVGRCARLTQPCHLTKGQISAAVQPRASELGIDLVWGSVEAVDIHGRSRSVSLTTAIDQILLKKSALEAMRSGSRLLKQTVDDVGGEAEEARGPLPAARQEASLPYPLRASAISPFCANSGLLPPAEIHHSPR